MTQGDIEIQHEWSFGRIHSYPTVYSNFFDTSLIAGVKIEICSGILNEEECIVILSKTPCTPARATIKIRVKNHDYIIYQEYVNDWIDNYSLKLNLDVIENKIENIRNFFHTKYQCDITWHGYPESKPPERDTIYGSLQHFLTAPDFSDMVIVIGNKEIPVHKIILAAYSPVFLAMFKANMTESVNKRIVVTDIEVDTMEKVIDFMYTGIIHSVSDIDTLFSILRVADKYEIMTLVQLCEEKLSEKIRIENVLEILDGTSLYRASLQMKQTITSFMVKNKSLIVGLEGFTDLHNRKPELLFEFIMNGIAPD